MQIRRETVKSFFGNGKQWVNEWNAEFTVEIEIASPTNMELKIKNKKTNIVKMCLVENASGGGGVGSRQFKTRSKRGQNQM